VSLELRGEVQLPGHTGPGGFDHGDVHAASGRVFIAHTANGTVEVVDGERLEHLVTIDGCAEASGVLCPPSTNLVIAAARGSGSVLFIDPTTCAVTGTVEVGGKPNGLAWDARRRRILVADVAGNSVSIVDRIGGRIVASGSLPGRPRWAVHDSGRDHFLVNIREPSMVALVNSETAAVIETWPASSAGPHGLDLDIGRGRAFVACDAGQLICLDLNDGSEVARVEIAGEPDAIWFNADAAQVYVAIGRPGVIQVVETDMMTIRQTIEIEEGAKTTALDAARRALYAFKPLACSLAAFRIG